MLCRMIKRDPSERPRLDELLTKLREIRKEFALTFPKPGSKEELKLQDQFVDYFKLSVTVCHYPPGTSKWNPIEHRLFSEISKNWKGQPLNSYELILKYIRTTKTKTGLSVKATLLRGEFPTGQKVSNQELATIRLRPAKIIPAWNYTLLPRVAKM